MREFMMPKRWHDTDVPLRTCATPSELEASKQTLDIRSNLKGSSFHLDAHENIE
jgi:hypothetical protein